MKTADIRMLIRWAVVLFICMLLMPFAAELTKAETITLSYSKPTQSENCTNAGDLGSPIAGYRIWQLVEHVIDPDTLEVQLEGYLPGDYSFKATAYDENGAESRLTATTVNKTTAEFAVGTDTRVYSTIKTAGRFLFIAMGNIPAGTACDPEYFAQGELPNNEGLGTAYAVPADQVVWSGQSQTTMPVAVCE